MLQYKHSIMKIDKLEIWVHDHILKNENVRHFLYGVYQRALYLVSEKVKCEGRVEVITPDDGYDLQRTATAAL